MVAIVGLLCAALLMCVLLADAEFACHRKGTGAKACTTSQGRRAPSAGSACHGTEL